MRWVLSLAAICAASLAAGNARAEPGDFGRGFDVSRLLEQGVRYFHKKTGQTHGPGEVPYSLRTPSLVELEAMFPSRDPAVRDGFVRAGMLEFAHVGSMGTASGEDKGTADHEPRKSDLQPRLRLSLVARDWRGAVSIAGRGTIPTDQIRMTRSSRMLIGRLSIGEGPVLPFLHVGAGEWRYDPDMLPFLPRNQEFATQFSGGLEVRISKAIAFAWENNYVVLCRERREPQNVPTPYILGTFGVLNVEY